MCADENGETRGDDKYDTCSLMLNWHRKFARMSLKAKASDFERDSAFSVSVRDSIKGLFLTKVEVLPFQRLVLFGFSSDPLLRFQEAANTAERLISSGGREPLSPQGAGASDRETGPPAPVGSNEPQGGTQVAKLYLDATGAGSNRLILLNHAGYVAAAEPAVDKQGAVWNRIGALYTPPAIVNATVPSLDEELETWRARLAPQTLDPSSPVRQALLRTFAGLSVPLVYQMLGAAGIPWDEPLDRLTQGDVEALWGVWRGWQWALRDANFLPVVLHHGRSMSFSVLPWPSSTEGEEEAEGGGAGLVGEEDGWGTGGAAEAAVAAVASADRVGAAPDFASVSDCVDWFLTRAEVEELRAQMELQVERAVLAQRRRVGEFRRKLEEACGAGEAKRAGELLAANQHLVTLGMDSVLVPDWGSLQEGDTEPPLVEIRLDPALSAADNAAALFRRLKKLTRQGEAVQGLLDDATMTMMDLIQVRRHAGPKVVGSTILARMQTGY